MRIALLALAATLVPYTAFARHDDRPVVVYDTDVDFDDVAALAYLAQAHKQGLITLAAVTVANNGAGLPGSAIRHARCVLDAAGLLDEVPIADNGATVGPNVGPAILRGTVDTILQMTFADCAQPTTSTSQSAAALLRETIKRNHGLTVLTSGPLTNLSAALGNGNGVAAKVGRVVAMAGAIDVPGGIGFEYTGIYDDSQDLNAWFDPAATDDVVRTFGRKLTLVGVDATNDVPITLPFIADLTAVASTPEAGIVAAIGNNPILQFGLSLGQAAYWWDVLAAEVAVGEPVVSVSEVRVTVVLSGPQTGRTARDPHGTRIYAALSADRALFEEQLVATLQGELSDGDGGCHP